MNSPIQKKMEETHSNAGYIAVIIIFCWIVPSLIAGAFGSNKPIGFLKVFLLSLVISPIGGFIVAIASKPLPPVVPEYTCKYCSFKTTENSNYCPRCQRDNDGYTVEENRARFTKS